MQNQETLHKCGYQPEEQTKHAEKIQPRKRADVLGGVFHGNCSMIYHLPTRCKGTARPEMSGKEMNAQKTSAVFDWHPVSNLHHAVDFETTQSQATLKLHQLRF